MITWAKKEWIPDLKQIWKCCFQDEDSYIDFYFSNRFKENNMIVFLEENRPIAMASLLPAVCWETEDGRKKSNLFYIYAVATAPAFQGRGISSQLMKYSMDFLEKNNAIGILVPAEERLIPFYKKRGFYPAIKLPERKSQRYTEDLKAAEIISLEEKETDFKFSEINPKEYKKIRDCHFAGRGYVEWDEESIQYAIAENKKNGGFTYGFFFQEQPHILMAYPTEKQLCVRETTLSKMQWNQYAPVLADKLDCRGLSQMPLFSMSNRKKWDGNGYLGLTLD
ncbi:MAG: GNAT family N-acetyltransferase [Acetivibrio sp.]